MQFKEVTNATKGTLTVSLHAEVSPHHRKRVTTMKNDTKQLSLNMKRVRKSVRTDVNTGKPDTFSFMSSIFGGAKFADDAAE